GRRPRPARRPRPRRPGQLHRAGREGGPVGVRRAPAGAPARAARDDHRLPRHAGRQDARAPADRVRLDHPDRRRTARRRTRPAGASVGHRGVPLRRGGGELHPQGAGGFPRRPRAPAAGHPGGGERDHPDDGRALDLLRGPPADL
ncbi:MAG: Leucine-responsive regulatory protein, regulator for leucine (or lrp) regulon and high-affinity branched-chain amino acid transport system, partial [uncultured Blastococcus sp.]